MEAPIDFESMLALAAGEMDAAAAGALERQLAASPDAIAQLERMRRAIRTMRTDDTTAPSVAALTRAKGVFDAKRAGSERSWLEGLRTALASLVYDSRVQPALAGFRSAQESVQLTYASDAAEIDIQLNPQRVAENVAWNVIGQVTPKSPAQPIAVRLLSIDSQAVVIEVRADQHGMFTMQMASGRYDMVVTVGDATVIVADVEIE